MINENESFGLKLYSLKGDYAFRRLQKGHTGYSKVLSVRWRGDQEGTIRVGIIVSKKVGKAVVRNQVRRRLREALWAILKVADIDLEAQFKKVPSFSLLIIAKPESAHSSYQDLKKALELSLGRAHLLS